MNGLDHRVTGGVNGPTVMPQSHVLLLHSEKTFHKEFEGKLFGIKINWVRINHLIAQML